MREGHLLAETDPELLIRKHGVSTLEDVFLKLCSKDNGSFDPNSNGLIGSEKVSQEELWNPKRAISSGEMKFNVLPSLAANANIAVAISLWCHDGADVNIHTVLNNLQNLRIPEKYKIALRDVLHPIGTQLYAWLYSWQKLDKLNHDLPRSKVFRMTYWKNVGTIDYRRTAMNILQSGILNKEDAFRLACVNCIEDHIFMLWPDVQAEFIALVARGLLIRRDLPNYYDEPLLIVYWVIYLVGKSTTSSEEDMPHPSQADKKNWSAHAMHILNSFSSSFGWNDFLTDAMKSGVAIAISYFINKLEPTARAGALQDSICRILQKPLPYIPCNFPTCSVPPVIDVRGQQQCLNCLRETGFPNSSCKLFNYSEFSGNSPVTLLFLLSEWNPDDDTIFKTYSRALLLYFLEWPLYHYFLQVTSKVFGYLSSDDFNAILFKIVCKISKQKSEIYIDIFEGFWESAPVEFKNNVLNQYKFVFRRSSITKLRHVPLGCSAEDIQQMCSSNATLTLQIFLNIGKIMDIVH